MYLAIDAIRLLKDPVVALTGRLELTRSHD
jgi:hypothetical protein